MDGQELEIPLGDSLNVDTVASVHSRLCDALSTGQDMALDLSQVVSFDTAGIQLLVATAIAARNGGTALRYCAPRAELARAVEFLDLVKYLGSWPGEMDEQREGA
ncbi:MAG: STAS domain-containing protein [Myxococcales bacterium]|nr:STAS domain-containing protein [Myxococcales bacterium]